MDKNFIYGFVALALSGCVVAADSQTVVIEHSADRTVFAEMKAKDYCARYGKKPVLVQTSPVKVNAIGFRTRISTFECR